MRAGGEGTFCDDEDVRKSLAASQEGLAGQPEPHSLVSMSSAEGTVPLTYIPQSVKPDYGGLLMTMSEWGVVPQLHPC